MTKCSSKNAAMMGKKWESMNDASQAASEFKIPDEVMVPGPIIKAMAAAWITGRKRSAGNG